MIQLNQKNGEKDKILELINSSISKSDYELECLFYDNVINNNNPKINNDNFMSLLKRYKNNPNYISNTTERLTIQLPRDNEKFNNIRILINGSGAIKNYCNNENISLIRNNINFEYKTSPKGLNRVAIPNYNFKLNLKEEHNFNNDESRINELLREINDIPKTYRYKKIFSFKKKTNDFQIDISIVKNSTLLDNHFLTVKEIIEQNKQRDVEKPKDSKITFINWWNSVKDKPTELVKIKNSMNYVKTIKESNVFHELPHYEVEVEYIKNKHNTNPTFKNIVERKDYVQTEFVNFFKEIGTVLQCLHNSFYILSNDELLNVKHQFLKVVENSIDEKMLEHNFKAQQKMNKTKTNSKTKTKTETKSSLPKQKGGNDGSGSDMYSLNEDNDINFEEKINDETIMAGGTQIVSGHHTIDDEDNSNIINYNDDMNGGDKGDSVMNGVCKRGGGSNVYDNEDDDNNEGNGYEDMNQIGGAKKLAELKYKIISNLKYNIFFGPLIIDLLHTNADHIPPSAIPDPRINTNIHINYLVTDKTDGDRNLLFFNEQGKAYGISRETTSQIKYFGVIIPSLANTILDGEYISRSYENKLVNHFYIFDSYIYKGENVIIKPFLFNKKGGTNGRYDTILNSIKAFTESTNITQLNSKLPFLLFKKEYMLSDTPERYERAMLKGKPSLMNENCKNILNKMNVRYGGLLDVGHLFPYKTDGLVFHPNNLAVFQTTMDSYIVNPFVSKGKRWNNNYKWKAQDHLTIDFKIKIIKDMETNKPDYSYFGESKYVKVNLLTAIYHTPNTRKDHNRLNFYLINSGRKFSNLPSEMKFLSTTPFIGSYNNEGIETNQMGEAYFKIDVNDNIICSDGSIITDNVICECSYNLNKDIDNRWMPIRIRTDKDKPNAYLTANAAWMLINNPITKHKLINNDSSIVHGNDSSDIKEKSAFIEKELKTKDYYSALDKTNLSTGPLNKFNNFVKRYLINRALSGYTKPNVIDLAVGEFGDLDKYIKNDVNHLLGIDINEHNLNNSEKGAATRIMEQTLLHNNSQYTRFADKVILINGTGTKNIANGDCVFDNLNKYYLDVLYGRAKGNTTKLSKMEGVGLDGYDLITCMYAIHYMMNDETSLDNFLRNVSENLLDQCYFIGTFLDGMEILNKIGNRRQIKGEVNGKNVFYIKKISDDDDDYKTITVGNKIEVFFETFATPFTENLVSISYLEEKAKKHNLKLIEFRGFLDEPGNMLSKFATDGNKIATENAKQIKEEEALMTWAKFNSYFIFQKVKSDQEL